MFGTVLQKILGKTGISPRDRRRINKAIKVAECASKLSVGPGLAASSNAAGMNIALAAPQEIYAKITSGSGVGPYAFIQQVPGPAGTWTDGWITGTTSPGGWGAYNDRGALVLSLPLYTTLTWATSGEFRFNEC